MKIVSPRIVTLTVLIAAWTPMNALASEQLVQKYGCTACHAADQKIVGPAWSSIRDKYRDGSVTPDQLAKTIRSGSSKKWGPIAMPPQAIVPEAEAQTIASWILGAK